MLARGIPYNQDAGTPDDKPILTLASLSRKRTEVNQYGLPVTKSTPGLYRFPSDEVGALSAGEQTRLPPNPSYPKRPDAVMFATTGNNVYQPSQYSGITTNALITKLADNKFKAEQNDGYSKYVQQLKLEREISEIEKTASVEQLGLAREVLRSAMAERRKQNEDDYLRKMLDSGLSVEDAKDEIDNVRRANALQEVRKVDDREYQSKLLLVNLARKRGVLSSTNEPLSQSAPVMNPAPNDQLATLGGNKADGFGNAPLDLGRKFLTPEYYGRFLRRSTMTQEEGDRQQAMNSLITSGKAGDIQFPSQFDARQREMNIEFKAESLANQLGVITNRPRMEPFTPVIFMTTFMNKLKQRIGYKKEVRVGLMPVSQMDIHQLVYSINRRIAENFTIAGQLASSINNFMPTIETANLDTLRNILRELLSGIDEYKTIMSNVAISASPQEIFVGSQETLQTLRSGRIGQFGRISAEWRRMIMVAAEPDELRRGLIANLRGVTSDKKPVNPEGTMYFSKVEPPETVGTKGASQLRITDMLAQPAPPPFRPRPMPVERVESQRDKTKRLIQESRVKTSLPFRSVPKPTSINNWYQMTADYKEDLLRSYGLPVTGTRLEQYTALMKA